MAAILPQPGEFVNQFATTKPPSNKTHLFREVFSYNKLSASYTFDVQGDYRPPGAFRHGARWALFFGQNNASIVDSLMIAFAVSVAISVVGFLFGTLRR